jgi:hypothetical protein
MTLASVNATLQAELTLMQTERRRMYSSAANLTRKLNLAWQASEKVEDVAIAVGRSSCANLDIAMVELEQSLQAAATQWMALVVLLGLTGFVFLVDAYHSLHLINLSRGLRSRTARPIYKKPGRTQLDAITGTGDPHAPPEPIKGKEKLPPRASSAEEGEEGRTARSSSVIAQSGVASDFCEDLLLDPSRFETPITAAITAAPPEKRRNTVAQVKFAWSSTNAFSKVASIQHAVDYERRRRGSAPPIFPRMATSRAGLRSRSADVAESSAAGENATPRSVVNDGRAPRGSDRRVAPAL